MPSYLQRVNRVQSELAQLKIQKRESISRLGRLDAEVRQSQTDIKKLKKTLLQNQNQCKVMTAELSRGRQRLGKAFADEDWWKRPEAVIEMSTPWVDRELDDARSELFIAALRVHQAFIERSASKIRRNIGLWLELIRTGKLPGLTHKRALTLWQTAFLVIPVISTTFASVGRLFEHLDQETLGWLLVDEAGQAVPQAAIGALWRAKRAVVVGDPLQLEPIFTVHSDLVEGLRHHFQLEDCWNPHSYSAQGLADRVNPFGTELKQLGEPLWVGCPLRVHRRCINPMFSLANQIAYGGKMVLATNPPEGISFPAGQSRWIHVSGEYEGKHWVPNQGEQLLNLLAQITSQGAEISEVFIITPFREVSNTLKKLLSQREDQWALLQLNAVQKQTWLEKSVGTIHTFQGREANIVILILGLDETKTGAAQWASQKANLLNVAATRARYRLYVLGDQELWTEYDYFDTAFKLLAVDSPI